MERRTYDAMRTLEQSHWWFTARREILAAEIAALGLPPDARILEAGCGPGGNLDLLSRFGRVTAIEPDAESRAYAAQRSGLAVHAGLLPDGLPDLGEPFDLVAAFDVIEHVEDDQGAVAALTKLLKPGGLMITTVPAYAWLWSAHDVRHHHKRRYARNRYLGLFEAAGLTICRASHFNAVLFPPIAVARIAGRLAGRTTGNDESLPPAFLNTILHALFGLERRLLRLIDLPFGVSILLVAQKPR